MQAKLAAEAEERVAHRDTIRDDDSRPPRPRYEDEHLPDSDFGLEHHDIGDSEHTNGIISALVVLAIDERNKGWKLATLYTPILSAIITISRLMVVYMAYDNRNARVKRLMRAELMSEAKARTLGMRIRYTTNAPGTVEWQGNEITIGQASFRLADLRSTVQGLHNSTRIQLF
ncbi:hypothetical protein D6D12_10754 [Aureobasidium pullulans]|uniref:Uncharacterized protein n=1 Tax=Aureobasidium pullulans TaxID=5580 RepID=A0AB74JCV3_AURPU|nr:hypothetical protein D6D12_10754 [Aureobasidium pullulans]THX30582.1 hypothetical protein D6D11_09981 [Aureobasidium pullulans]